MYASRGPRKDRRKGFTETDYADFWTPRTSSSAARVVVWDNLNVHVSRTMPRVGEHVR